MSGGSRQPGADAWSGLWRTGTLHSCCTSIRGNYDGAIADFWDARFAPLGPGATIVDIGTGNGAVPLLARQHAAARGIGFDIHGTDLADIDPVRWVDGGQALFSGIRFHPGTPATSLPFADGGVSLLTSQYAFEYSRPMEATVAEILRVTIPHGRIAMVVHGWDSVIARVGRLQAEACTLLLQDGGIFDRAAEMAGVLGSIAGGARGDRIPPDPAAERVRQAFNHASGQLFEHLDAVPEAVVLDKAVHCVRNALHIARSDVPGALRCLDQGRESIRGEQARLADLEDAVMDLASLQRLQAMLHEGGFSRVDVAPLDLRAGVRMGWTVVASDERG